MVRVRLRQWSSAVTGPRRLVVELRRPDRARSGPSPAPRPPAWADRPAPIRRRRAIARDLVASLNRFNRRWTEFLDRLDSGTAEPVRRPLQPLLPPGEGVLPRLGPAGRPPLRPAGTADPRGPPRCASHVARPRARRLRGRAERATPIAERPWRPVTSPRAWSCCRSGRDDGAQATDVAPRRPRPRGHARAHAGRAARDPCALRPRTCADLRVLHADDPAWGPIPLARVASPPGPGRLGPWPWPSASRSKSSRA